MYEPFIEFQNFSDGPNQFYPLSEKEIAEAETRLCYALPTELRQFYREVGCGFFSKGRMQVETDLLPINRIISPGEAADLLLDQCDFGLPPEGLPAGSLPFMDIGEDSYFLMKPLSETPNAVFRASGTSIITDSFCDFMFQLLDDSEFYDRR